MVVNPPKECSLGCAWFSPCINGTMPLLFFWLALPAGTPAAGRKPCRAPAERLRGCLFPCLVGILLLVPPQVYLHDAADRIEPELPAVFPHFFDEFRASRSFWKWAHLWFFWAICWVISLFCHPVLLMAQHDRSHGRLSLLNVPGQCHGSSLPASCSAADAADPVLVRVGRLPERFDDWANLSLSSYFFYGYLILFASQASCFVLDKQRWTSLKPAVFPCMATALCG